MAKRNIGDATAAPLSLPEVRVVEASAGSGKTYALAARYLRLLMEPGEDLGAILAITFTNKATREMKGRILDLLKRLALDAFGRGEEKAELVKRLAADEAGVGPLAARLVERIVRDYHRFQVQTIDSFVNVLLSGCASELGLSPGFRIARTSGEYLAWSIDRCIERAAHEPRVREMIRAFIDQYLFLDRKAHWFPRTDILAVVGRLFGEYNLYGEGFVRSGASPERVKRQLHGMLAALRARAPEGTHAVFIKALDGALRGGGDRLDLADLKSAFFRRDEYPMTGKREAPAECRALWRRIRAKIPEAAEAEAGSLFDCYIGLFELAAGEFAARARDDDVVFLEELNRRARDLFASGRVGVPELYLRLATAFRHFLIDEFQDTSGLQWRNLEGMVREALSTGGSLFYVGDRKQAIYRFRGGDVGLFDAVAGELSDQAPVRRETLALNRRSRRAIVEFNNEVFSEENLRRFAGAVRPDDDEDQRAMRPGDVDALAAVFRAARQTHLPRREPGCVRVETVGAAAGGDAREAVRERLIAIVRELGGRFEPEEIAVLAGRNEEVEQVTAWLTEARIAAASDRTLSVAHNPLVKEIVALLGFLDSPVDNLSFASFILGRIFASASGIAGEEMHRFLFSLRGVGAARGASCFYREFRDRYPDAWRDHLEELFRNVGFVPLYELVADILQRFRVYRHFGEYQGFFLRFLELIREQEEECGDIRSFLSYLDGASGEDLFVRFPGVNAVRVMTIHKAKGLGFPAVVVPFLAFDPGGRGGGSPYRVVRHEGGISLLRLDRKYTLLSTRLRDEYREEYRGRFIDGMNAVYVAFTRAVEELRVLMPRPARGENAAEALIPEALRERGAPRSRKAAARGPDRLVVDLGPPEYRNWIAFLREECADAGEITRRDELSRGEVLHCMLSSLGDLSGEDSGAAVSRAAESARESFPLARGLSECEAAVRRLLARPEAREIFFPGCGAAVFTEKEVVDAQGRTHRIDRLIVYPGSVRVVDWKSSAANREAHAAQMRGYAELVGERYPGRRVRCSLVYLDSGEVEDVAPGGG